MPVMRQASGIRTVSELRGGKVSIACPTVREPVFGIGSMLLRWPYLEQGLSGAPKGISGLDARAEDPAPNPGMTEAWRTYRMSVGPVLDILCLDGRMLHADLAEKTANSPDFRNFGQASLRQ